MIVSLFKKKLISRPPSSCCLSLYIFTYKYRVYNYYNVHIYKFFPLNFPNLGNLECYPTISILTDSSGTYFFIFIQKILPYLFIWFNYLILILSIFYLLINNSCFIVFSCIYYYDVYVDLFGWKGIPLRDKV